MEINDMFKENNGHLQQSFLTSENYMNPSVHARLLKSWACVFYNTVFCNIKETIFAVLYCENNGRPNFPVNILISLEYIKHLFDYSDEELIDQFYFNYQIAYALGIKNVGAMNLCPGTIYEFRRKLYSYSIENPESDDLIFTQFIELTKEFAKQSNVAVDKQRMDSTMISANVKSAGRLALAYDVLEQALKVLPQEILTESMKEILEDGYKKKVLYKSKGPQIVSRIQETLNICEEVAREINCIPEMNDLQEIMVLKRFISEQTKIDPETGKRKTKENKEICANSLQSAYDQDATYRKKGKKAGKGYSVNISETCNEANDVQFITHYDVKPNIATDAEFAAEAIPEIKSSFGLTDMYVDGGYCGKDVTDVADSNKVTMHYTDMTGKKAEGDGITAGVFEFNEDKTVKLCPANVQPIDTKHNPESGTISAHFSKEACENCEFKDRCCIKEQVRANKFSTTENTLKAEKLRKNMLNERKENTSLRAAIEGTNSELKSRHGLDDLKVRGTAKVTIVTGLKISACNFKRFAKSSLRKLTKTLKSPQKDSKQGIVMQF